MTDPTPTPLDLAALRDDMETRAATDPNIDAWVNAGTVLALIDRAETSTAALDFYVAQRKELQSTLSMLADRLDEFSYDELSSLILDEHSDEWGESYRSKLEEATARAEAAEAKIAAVRALHYPIVHAQFGPEACWECAHPYPCPTIAALDGTA